MSPKYSFLFALALGAATALHASPITEATLVFNAPDDAANAIALLPAGTEPVFASGTQAPAGWTAVSIAGPHEVYSANKNVTKALDARVGSPYLTDAKEDAPVLTLATKDDVAEIIDYRGKFTKFRLTKAITGYIKTPVAGTSASALIPAVTSSTPVASVATSSTQQVGGVGRAAPVGDGASNSLPRLYQGKFASTQSPMRPRRPYDYQLTDDAGARYAFVDVSKLLATEQITKFTGRTVVVYGTAKAVPGTREMVVIAESLQLR